jgi:predicted dienelactone hydrolase
MRLTTHRPLSAVAGATGAAPISRSGVLASLTAAALALGLAGQLPRDATAAADADMAEKVRVGHTVERIMVKGSAQDEMRPVDVHLWYPADHKGPKTVYKSALYGAELIPRLWDPLSWKIEAEVAREAPIDRDARGLPVIVFSHGSVNDPIDYAYTLELIAGAGFVVAAPYHVNNTQDDVRIDFINGEAAKVEAGLRLFECKDGRPSPCARPDVARSMNDRVRDIGAILDELPKWLGDRVDVSRAGILGHSRGTVTALAAAGGSPQWGFGPLQDRTGVRVKAIMGMAIGVRAITFGADLVNVRVPALLVAGGLDRNSVPQVSAEALAAISSEDKELVSFAAATHRSFDSTYCAQMQAAGAIADKNGDRAILDLHTFRGIVSSPVSGKAVHYCAPDFFMKPDLGPLASSVAGSEFPPTVGDPSVCITTSIPCTGLDTDQVKQAVTELAVGFFRRVLDPGGN